MKRGAMWKGGACVLLGALMMAAQGEALRGILQQKDCEDCGPGCPQIAFLIGGENLAGPEPFMASLRKPSGDHFCAGTLIASNVVLTAAHCLWDNKTPKVHIGRFSRVACDGYDFEVFKTIKYITHPAYNKNAQFDNDIALLVLDSKSSKTPIKLGSSDSCFESGGGCQVRLLGWGDTTTAVAGAQLSGIIQEAFTASVSRSTCEAQVGASRVTSAMICAGEPEGGIDSCQGDSGGPMIVSGRQVGIVSWGDGCAEAGNPGVYTSVPKLLGWIQQELDRISGSSSSGSGPPVGGPGGSTGGSSLDDCDCAVDGVSGGVATGRFGCKKHLLDQGDSDRFCMVSGGAKCPSATASSAFPGAAWKICGSSDPCECAQSGVSGGVSTGRFGCAQHLQDYGDNDIFCMVRGGSTCSSSNPSQQFPGATWKLCG